ncbi:MAG TPA: hypothetical protein PK683_20095 [Leptospiraceae bacterium]|nr:hypothetical protein [Leptospiraceae bacterium]
MKKFFWMFLLVPFVHCNREILQNYAAMGGKPLHCTGENSVTCISEKPVFEDQRVKNVTPAAGTTLSYKGKAGTDIFRYSNINHISNWVTVPIAETEDDLRINRTITLYSYGMLIYKIIMFPFTLGMSLVIPHEFDLNDLILLNMGQFSNIDHIKITIGNAGKNDLKSEIHILEALPSFLKFDSLEYSVSFAGMNIDTEGLTVSYDVKSKDKNQYIPIIIKPGKKGFESKKILSIKINVKPDEQDFLKNFRI